MLAISCSMYVPAVMVLAIECNFRVVMLGTYSLWTAEGALGRVEHADVSAALPMWWFSLSGCRTLYDNEQVNFSICLLRICCTLCC